MNDFMKGGGTDAPEDSSSDEEEDARPSVTYDDMWAKTLLDGSDGSVNFTLINYFFDMISQSHLPRLIHNAY